MITGCALKRNTPTKPMLESGSRARELRANGELSKAMATYLRAAEDAADTAVNTAETRDTFCHHLRDTSGAHQDFLYAIETPEAHEQNTSEKNLDDLRERTNERKRTEEQTYTHNQDVSLGL